MTKVFVINSNDFPFAAEFNNVYGYIHMYYKIIKELIPLSYKYPIKIICDEASVCLFDNLPVTSIVVCENVPKRFDKYVDWDDEIVNVSNINEKKEELKEYIRLTYPNAWKSVVGNVNTRFL